MRLGLPLPRALDTGACRANTPLGPRTPSHADLAVGSDQAGRAGPCAPSTYDEQVSEPSGVGRAKY